MKNLLTLVVLMFTSTIGYAQNMVAKAIFFSEEGFPFQVVINGLIQNPTPGTNIQVPVTSPGPYKIKILFKDTALGVISDKIYMDPGMEQTYSIGLKKYSDAEKKAKSVGSSIGYHFTSKSTKEYKEEQSKIDKLDARFVVRLLNKIPLNLPPPVQQSYAQPAPPPQQYSQQTTVVQQAPAVSQTTTTTVTGTPGVVGANVGVSVPGVSMNMNIGGMQTTHQSTTTTTTTSGAQVNQQQVYVMPGYSGPTGCPWPMQASDFAAAKNTIASKGFEDSKMSIAKQLISSNCLFASQVREIMVLFDFEQSKLDFAKFAYGYTYDIGNYFKVNDAFEFESSIEDLNQFIAGRGR
ncbi:MAG: DUF4476 domain-containing protein [Bacteroidota bacterium]|jgi:hypothetical protein